LEQDRKIVVEGAQATLLDIDFGSYPFVTSSNPTIGGIITGTGISASDIGNVYGVIKAYSSRVGEGPYVTELLDATGDRIRELGHEYGTTTGRPRRCGWLDLLTLKYAKRVNGLTALSVNHLDTIGKFDKIKVCVAYDVDGVETEDFSTNLKFLNSAKPVYREFDGNFGDIAGCKTFEELPENAQKYINFIEEYIGIPVKFIGTGADREAMIVREV
jgi:adenylosuccinate synthase